VVANAVVDATRSYYQMIGVPDAKITYVNSVNSGHAFISPDNGVTQDCPVNASPYVNRCTLADGNRYDQAKALLTQIYGTLNPASASPQGQIVAFDQSKFNGIGMADTGYLYVPNACASGQTCKIHVAFHGCGQSAGDIGSLYYTETGYNPWSDTNNILVLYPQVSTTLPTNPDHCWDWFGYTGPNFNVKSSSQMSAIKAMIDRLAGQ
jgi:hypothetical protein